MWVIGGESDAGKLNDVWYSDNGTTWTLATASAGFSPRMAHTSLVYDNKIWVIVCPNCPLAKESLDGLASGPRHEKVDVVYGGFLDSSPKSGTTNVASMCVRNANGHVANFVARTSGKTKTDSGNYGVWLLSSRPRMNRNCGLPQARAVAGLPFILWRYLP